MASTFLSYAAIGTSPGGSTCALYASATSGGGWHPINSHFSKYRWMNAS
jgi:hypothetical protein